MSKPWDPFATIALAGAAPLTKLLYSVSYGVGKTVGLIAILLEYDLIII